MISTAYVRSSLYNSVTKSLFDNVQYLISALNSVFVHEIFSLNPFNAAARSAIDKPSPLPSRLLLDFSPRTKGFFRSLTLIFSLTVCDAVLAVLLSLFAYS